MKQEMIIKGYRKLEELKGVKFPAAISFKIYKLKKQLKECYDWQSEQETEIFKDYGGKWNDDGSIVIDDMTKAQEFADKLGALSQVEHDEIEKIDIPIDCFEALSMDDMEALENIINFVE